MPNNITLAQQFVPVLDEIYKLASLTSSLDGSPELAREGANAGELIIPMLEIPVKIMEKYRDHPTVVTRGVVLPVMTNQKANAYLKELADLAKIQKHLTTHSPRHTFATMSLNNHVPLETISKMLGHSDITTTQIYAKMLDKTISEDMETMRNKFNGMSF